MRPIAFPAAVAAALDHLHVASMDDLLEALDGPSPRTVSRKLREIGALSSYSHGGHYYTLRAHAQFDADGLWDRDTVRFSTHGTLRATVVALTEGAPRGWFPRELDELVGVSSQVTLQRLVADGKLACVAIDGRSLYCSADPECQRRQVAARCIGGFPLPLPACVHPAQLTALVRRFVRVLDERQRRLGAGLVALLWGPGGDHRAAAWVGLHPKTVAKGRRELVGGRILLGRVRRPGGGRKPLVKKGNYIQKLPRPYRLRGNRDMHREHRVSRHPAPHRGQRHRGSRGLVQMAP